MSAAEPELPDDWCPKCRQHRIRQDTYSGAPTYKALCPVCADPTIPNHTTQTQETA